MGFRLKYIILTVLLLWITVSGCTEQPKGKSVYKPAQPVEDLSSIFLTDYDYGLELAHRENKPLLVYFMAENCVFSRQMTEETLSDRTFREFAKNFVCVQIDIGEKQSERLCDELQIKGSPTIQFMSPAGIPLQRLTQPQPAKELVHQMQAVLYSMAWKEVKYYL